MTHTMHTPKETRLVVLISSSLHRRLRIHAADKGKLLKEIVAAALDVALPKMAEKKGDRQAQ